MNRLCIAGEFLNVFLPRRTFHRLLFKTPETQPEKQKKEERRRRRRRQRKWMRKYKVVSGSVSERKCWNEWKFIIVVCCCSFLFYEFNSYVLWHSLIFLPCFIYNFVNFHCMNFYFLLTSTINLWIVKKYSISMFAEFCFCFFFFALFSLHV